MRILVTGAAGFVGAHLVDGLAADGDMVLPADILTGDDVTYERTARRLVSWGPDVIVHLAATCSTPGSMRDPLSTYRNTVTSAAVMTEAARESRTPFLLVSSVKARDGMTPYGAAKRMAETWAQEYSRTFGLPLIVHRPGTIYGPGQEGSPESGWIAWFLKARREGHRVTVNGSGEQERDLLHVSDYVRLIRLQVHDFDQYAGGVFDVGGGDENAVTVNEMVEFLGLEADHGPERNGDAFSYVGRNKVKGWKPEVFWQDGIRDL